MAGHAKKATKKFEKKHLKGTLERRKDFAKVKQRNQVKAKKKARNARDKDEEKANRGENGIAPEINGKETHKPEQDKFKDMSVDDFFQGGFDIPDKPAKQGKRATQEREKSKKRKRTEDVDGEDESSSERSLEENGVLSGSEAVSEAEDDMDTHRGDLDALAEKDPEFYKFLKENDAELLEFAEHGDLAEVDELSADDKEVETKQAKKRKKGNKAEAGEDDKGDSQTEITMAMVEKWRAAVTEQASLRAMRQVVLAFRAAAHLNEDSGQVYKYSISSPDVYHELLVLTLKHVPTILNHHLPVKELPHGRVRIATESKKFRTLTPLLKSHAASVIHLLESLSDAKTLKLTLSSILPLLPYMLPFKQKALRPLLRAVVSIWSDPSSASADEATRITAFLVLRRLVVIGDAGMREAVLKTTYTGLVKGSRVTTIHTLPAINLMKNSAAELWGMDANVGYTTGFHFIRQLAIHLRTTIKNPGNEAYKQVYNWQYVHSLDFWSRVLAAHCDSMAESTSGGPSALRPLIYPCVQLTLGALRLIPTASYFPLRFHLARSLLRLSRATGTYIPLAPALLEVLESNEMQKAPKASTLKPLAMDVAIRAPKAYLRTRTYQDGLGQEVVELLAEFFALWCKNVAFPELSLPVVVQLRRWLKAANHHPHRNDAGKKKKGNRNPKVNAAVAVLVQKLEHNARWIEERRARVEFSPRDRQAVDAFLADVDWSDAPVGAYVVGQRKMKEERERLERERHEDREKERDERREKNGNGKGKGEGEVTRGGGEFSEEDDDDDEEEDEEEMDGIDDDEDEDDE